MEQLADASPSPQTPGAYVNPKALRDRIRVSRSRLVLIQQVLQSGSVICMCARIYIFDTWAQTQGLAVAYCSYSNPAWRLDLSDT